MGEEFFKNKPPESSKPDALNQGKQEQEPITVKVAGKDDWQDLKEIRLIAINSKDKGMFGPKLVARDRAKTDEDWQADLSPDNKDLFFVLAYSGSEVIGMGQAQYYNEEDAWYISSAYTKDNFRGKVPPRKALLEFLNEIKNRNGSKVMIGVRTENKDPIKLYKILGFKMKKNIPAILNNILNRGWQIMELDLTKQKDKI